MLEVIDKGSTTASHPVPLLFVHGAYQAAWCWDENFVDYFANKGFRALAVSLRGHGQSTRCKPLRSCSIADYVEDVRAVADKLGCEPVPIGHSMGCLVVEKYLEKYRAPVAVLMAPATPKGVRRSVLRMCLRHPWIFMRASTFGSSADLVNTPALAREFLPQQDRRRRPPIRHHGHIHVYLNSTYVLISSGKTRNCTKSI